MSKTIIVVFSAAALVAAAFGYPYYRVWEQELAGQAERALAGQNRQIRTLEAQAKKESAQLEAEAEVLRAKGFAEANRIIQDSLSGPTAALYLNYLWIQGLEKGDNREVHYIPTERGIPILAAPPSPPVKK